jgi:hypothetical protein
MHQAAIGTTIMPLALWHMGVSAFAVEIFISPAQILLTHWSGQYTIDW